MLGGFPGERGRFPGNPSRRGGRRRERLSPRLLRVPTSMRQVGNAQESIFPLGLPVAQIGDAEAAGMR